MSPELLQTIEGAYGLPPIIKTQDVATGVLSSNWILHTSDTRYFLKRYRYPERARIESVHAVKAHFSTAGIPIIMPFATRDGQTCYTFGDHHFALFPYIVGTESTRGALSDTSIISIAEMLAHLHQAGRDVRLTCEIPTFNAWSKERFVSKAEPLLTHLRAIEAPTPFDILALQDLNEKYIFVESNSIAFEGLNLPSDHLLHGDFLDHNLFFDNTGLVSHVFDLEKATYGPRVYELLRTIFLCIFDGEITSQNAHQAKLFMDTYRALYPISNDEIERGIITFLTKTMHNTWIQNEHYILNNYRADMYLETERTRNTILTEHRSTLEHILL